MWWHTLLVAVQIGALGVLGWAGLKAWPWPGWVWVPLGLSAVILAWAAVSLGNSLTPHPTPNARGLKTGGIYGWVRHPMYLGLLVAGGAVVGVRPDTWWAATGLLFSLVCKTEIEERLLAHTYPDFADYRQKTWKLLPFIW